MKKLLIALCLISAPIAVAGLITDPPAQTQVTQNSSTADRQAASLNASKSANTMAIQALKRALVTGYMMAFKNPYSLSPQQYFAAWGIDGCKAHQAFITAAQLISAADPSFTAPAEPCTVTCNQDGTVSLVCASPSPSPSPSPSASPSP